MTVNDLVSLSKNLHELCAKAEEVVSRVPEDDPNRARLLEHLQQLQKVTAELNDCQEPK